MKKVSRFSLGRLFHTQTFYNTNNVWLNSHCSVCKVLANSLPPQSPISGIFRLSRFANIPHKASSFTFPVLLSKLSCSSTHLPPHYKPHFCRKTKLPQHTTLQPLVPMLRLDLTLDIDFGCLTGGGDTGIDGSFALFVDFGFLTKENNGESGTSAHGYKV